MPRYFFHRVDGGFDADRIGTELRDIQDARIEAVAFAGETLRKHPDIIWAGHEMTIQVTNESGRRVFMVKISAHDELSQSGAA